ncbi:hypothetical protein [Formosa haliotis]|uniref:hypothetical protein n=1 Tax=Formosa haliotis TaxID=1555194 RepID=UPI001356439A|nr:hypothetical protein [Formosa haliotis]
MLKKLVSTLGLVLFFLIVSCDSSTDDGYNIDFPYFDSLNVQGNVTLVLQSGPNQIV